MGGFTMPQMLFWIRHGYGMDTTWIHHANRNDLAEEVQHILPHHDEEAAKASHRYTNPFSVRRDILTFSEYLGRD